MGSSLLIVKTSTTPSTSTVGASPSTSKSIIEIVTFNISMTTIGSSTPTGPASVTRSQPPTVTPEVQGKSKMAIVGGVFAGIIGLAFLFVALHYVYRCGQRRGQLRIDVARQSSAASCGNLHPITNDREERVDNEDKGEQLSGALRYFNEERLGTAMP